MRNKRIKTPPLFVLIGGTVVFDDGSVVDSRQKTKDRDAARAIQQALIASTEWWNAVVSIVVPTLTDKSGGFATVNHRTVPRARQDGRVQRVRLPLQPRRDGSGYFIEVRHDPFEDDDEGEWDPEPDEHTEHPRVRIDLTGGTIQYLANNPTAFPETQLYVAPDTPAMRKLVNGFARGFRYAKTKRRSPFAEAVLGPELIRVATKSCVCGVTGVSRDGRWVDPAILEAARKFVLERYDVRVGLWDLAQNESLRETLLSPRSWPAEPEGRADVPRIARRRAELESGAVVAALFLTLKPLGWTKHGDKLMHLLDRERPEFSDPAFPHLWIQVKPHQINVTAWEWHYDRFDINAYVDSRRAEFDAISVVPPRKQISESTVKTLARYSKTRDVRYTRGRLLDDTRWVILWKTECGWADVDSNWSAIAREIARKTVRWVKLLNNAANIFAKKNPELME